MKIALDTMLMRLKIASYLMAVISHGTDALPEIVTSEDALTTQLGATNSRHLQVQGSSRNSRVHVQ